MLNSKFKLDGLNFNVYEYKYKYLKEPIRYVECIDTPYMANELRVIKILFYDPTNSKPSKDVCYLQNIHKYTNITGTKVTQIAIKVAKKFGFKKIILYDGTTIGNNIPLSFIKYIEKGETFYERFGFKPDLSVGGMQHYMNSGIKPFETSQNLIESMENARKEFCAITVKEAHANLLKVREYLASKFAQVPLPTVKEFQLMDTDSRWCYVIENPTYTLIGSNSITIRGILTNMMDMDILLDDMKTTKKEYFYEMLMDIDYIIFKGIYLQSIIKYGDIYLREVILLCFILSVINNIPYSLSI